MINNFFKRNKRYNKIWISPILVLIFFKNIFTIHYDPSGGWWQVSLHSHSAIMLVEASFSFYEFNDVIVICFFLITSSSLFMSYQWMFVQIYGCLSLHVLCEMYHSHWSNILHFGLLKKKLFIMILLNSLNYLFQSGLLNSMNYPWPMLFPRQRMLWNITKIPN